MIAADVRLRIYHEMLMDAIQAGRDDAAYFLARSLYRLVTKL